MGQSRLLSHANLLRMENGANLLRIQLPEISWILVEKVIRRRKHYETFCLQEIKLADSLDAEGRD
jgi:hypothetical protein